MKMIKNILVAFVLSCLLFSAVSAGFFDSFINSGTPDIRYCDTDGECGLIPGTEVVRDGLDDGIERDRTFSQYVQDIALYIISFISFIAVVYIIYAGFMILIWNGEEEKLKKSKHTIMYVLIGITVIWLAYPLTLFIFRVLAS